MERDDAPMNRERGTNPGVRFTPLHRLLLLQSLFRAKRRQLRDRRMLARADAVVVSFPKSGRTWVRVMLSRLCQIHWDLPEESLFEFDNLHAHNAQIPRILFTHDVDAMIPASRIPPDKSLYGGRPLVLLARHPADVVVSRQHHLKHRSRDLARRRLAQAPLREFAWSEYGGLPAIVRFLNDWAAAVRVHPEFAIQRYEDFIADPHAALARMATILGLPADHAAVADAVAFAAFDQLKQREQQGFFATDRLRPRKEADSNSFKVRSGRAGGWKEAFAPADAEDIAVYLAEHLDPVFGYTE